MHTTSTNDPIDVIAHDCLIAIGIITTHHHTNTTVDVVGDGRVRINAGASTLFLSGPNTELLSHELLSAAVRAQYQTERGES